MGHENLEFEYNLTIFLVNFLKLTNHIGDEYDPEIKKDYRLDFMVILK